MTLTPFFSGISLDVTPQIDQHDVVTLHVRPTRSAGCVDQNKTIVLGGEDNVFNLPLALVHLASVRLHRAGPQRPGGGDRRSAAEQ